VVGLYRGHDDVEELEDEGIKHQKQWGSHHGRQKAKFEG